MFLEILLFFCGYNFSFTVLRPNVWKEVLDLAYETCDTFVNQVQFGFDLNGYRLYRKAPLSSLWDNRHFSCAEKKIIGYCEYMDIKIRELFTTKTPCYYCLPVIDSVEYLYQNKEIKTIKKSSGPYSIGDGLTHFLYRR